MEEKCKENSVEIRTKKITLTRKNGEIEKLMRTNPLPRKGEVQTPGSGISILLAVGTPSTGSGKLYCQWELSPGSGNALCILFPTMLTQVGFPSSS
nr:hypothetical protein [Tanacetum cinerariifolium]